MTVPLDDTEGLISLGFNGDRFASHAASELLRKYSCYSEIRYWLLRSAFARQDRAAIRGFLGDWKAMDLKPRANISKFTPGSHYHVLGTKLNTMDEALDYLRSRGYEYGGTIEKHVYKTDGD